MESICDGNIFTDADATEDGFLQVNTVSSAIVKNVSMLQTLVLDWHLWDKTPLLLQETLWKALETLVRPCHPFHAFNVMQFQRGRVVEHLLMGCQVCI